MTQREEVRFKVYTKAYTSLIYSKIYPLELIDFIEGDGTYDTTTYKYSVQNAGTYYWVYLIINDFLIIQEAPI